VDPRIKPFLTLDLRGDTYNLVEVLWMDREESGGRQHIFLDVVDPGGQRLVGEQVGISWPGGSVPIVIEEKPGEPWGANMPMYAALGSYAVQALPTMGTSDAVSGLGLGTPQEPGALHRTSFGVTFRKLPASAPLRSGSSGTLLSRLGGWLRRGRG
jgi:hypothetical protein